MDIRHLRALRFFKALFGRLGHGLSGLALDTGAEGGCAQHFGLLLNMDPDLPHMDRPPGVGEDEWAELLWLEAPSILGLALPGAEMLDVSEPTFPSESSEHGESGELGSAGSLEGYSPSPTASPVVRRGFNLYVSEELHLERPEPENASEGLALRALRDRWLWEEDLLYLTEHLPSSTRNFQRSTQGDSWSCSFSTGAFIHGVTAGVMTNSRRFEMVTALLAAVLRSVAPQAWFTSAGISLNIRSGVHRDSNNASNIHNVLVPASDFENGELWLEDGTGVHEMEGFLGRLVPVSRPFISFNPRVRHATSCWQGNRLVLIGYHVRNSEMLSPVDKTELHRLGFRVYDGRRP